MSAGPLTLELLLVFVATIYLLHKYGNWKAYHPIVTVATLIAWYFSFVIVVVLPLDVALTFYNKCVLEQPSNDSLTDIYSNTNSTSTFAPSHLENSCKKPGSFVETYVLTDLWRVVYWSSQILTWLVLPIMQSYSTNGQFSALPKLKSAVYENAIYYASYLLIVGVLLIYVAAKGISLNASYLKVICITASNTWGLFLLVLLLGYGLVEIPRQLWLSGNKGYRLHKTYFDLEKLSSEKNDAEESVKEALKDTKSAMNALRDGHPLKKCANIILEKFPIELVESVSRREESRAGRDSLTTSDAANLAANSESALARLHKRVITAVQEHQRTKAQWTSLVNKALHLEEVAKNETSATRQFVRSYRMERSMAMETLCSPIIEWYWECLVKGPLLKVLSMCLCIMSILLVWSECTFFSVDPTLSLAAIFINTAANNYDYKYIQLSSIVTILYLCVCAYYTVFKVRVYRYYHLDPHHQTDAKSLLFSAMMLCRLTPPLCLNFLGLIHLDTHVATEYGEGAETSFTRFMGHMDVIPIVSRGFNIYFPMLILALCLATYFKLGTRLLHSLGIDQFIGEDEMTAEFVQGGKALVQIERNRLQREANRESRQEYWNDKLSSHSSRRRAGNNCDDSYRDDVPIVPRIEEANSGFSADFMAPQRSNNNFNYGSPQQTTPTNTGIFDDL